MEGIVEALINGQSPDNYLSGNVGQITQTLNPNLFLLPGHLNVSELDSQISVSLKLLPVFQQQEIYPAIFRL